MYHSSLLQKPILVWAFGPHMVIGQGYRSGWFSDTKVAVCSGRLLCYCEILLVLAKCKGILNTIINVEPIIIACFHTIKVKYI